MKKSLAGSVIVLLVFFLSLGLGFAGNGKGGGNGPGNGTGPIHDILDGTPFTYKGEVIECQGDGMWFQLKVMETLSSTGSVPCATGIIWK